MDNVARNSNAEMVNGANYTIEFGKWEIFPRGITYRSYMVLNYTAL